MSEETPVVPKKKPIVPIAMALILVLLGGGYFMMKGKDKSAKKPAIAAAEKETELDEFLTNTQNPSVYVRTKINVTLKKDYEEAKFKDNAGDVRDAVILVLNSTAPADVTDPKKRAFLKKTLANAMNEALVGPQDPPDKPVHKKHHHKDDEDDTDAPDSKSADWDSQTGPVLKVRFVGLATQ